MPASARLRWGLGLVGLMWLLPFLSVHHAPPIPSFYGEWLAAALGLAALAVLLHKEHWQPFELPAIGLLPLGLAGLILLQILLGWIGFPQQALLALMYLLWAMLLMALGQQVRRALGWEAMAGMLAVFLLAGGLLNVLITCAQYAGLHAWMLVPKRAGLSYGNLAQPNHFADYMALALASLLYLRAKGRVTLPLFAGVAFLFLATLALSGSRSSWIYLIALTLLAWRHARVSGRRDLLTACALMLPAFLLIQLCLPWFNTLADLGVVTTPTERLFREVDGFGVRLQLWHEAWQMFLQSPWFGVGFGQFDWNSFVLVDRQAAGAFVEPAEHAHNIIMHLLAELGLPAGLLLLGMLAAWGVRSLRAALTLEAWWMLALLAVIGVHSLLEYPLWYTYFLGMAAFLLGAGDTRVLNLRLNRIGRPALLAILVLGGMGLANLAQAYGQLEYWMVRGLKGEVRDADLPVITQDLLQVHRESLLSPYVELVLAASIEPTPALLAEKLRLSEAAMHFSPIRQIVFRHALLLALHHDHAAALLQLHRAMRAYPQEVAPFRRTLQAWVARYPGSFEFLLDAMSGDMPAQAGS